MSGTITLGSAGGNIFINGGENEIVLDSGAGGGGGGSALTSYQNAVAQGYTGTETEYYSASVNVDAIENRTEVLTIISVNAINPLSTPPSFDVDFFVNGVLVTNGGITNSGATVTVNPVALGYNINPTIDRVTAEYQV